MDWSRQVVYLKFKVRVKALVNEDTLGGHIVAHDVTWAVQTGKHLLRTQYVSEKNQKHFLCPRLQQMLRVRANGETFVSQQCVRNNVSSFARAFKETSRNQ